MQSLPHEVERRYKVKESDLPEIRTKLSRLGFEQAYVQHQADEYFTSRHKDFIASEECLRIRSVDSATILTWKPPTTDEMRIAPEFWKQELEFPVDASPEMVRQFLVALDFISYTVVDKVRNTYRDQSGVEVSIDQVDRLGTFIEIEIKSMDVEQARQDLVQVAKELTLDDGDISIVPYRDLVKPGKS